MHQESSYGGRSGRPRRSSFRRNTRHPGLAEHDIPKRIPKPKGEIPEVFAENIFGQLHPLIQHAVAEAEYITPTPIQEQAIPHLLEGKDLLGCAQTGTGKTAAFLLPILQRITMFPKPEERNRPRALILAPTRELAAQIANNITTYGKFLGIPFAVVFGGVSQFPQVNALNRGALLVVATPGRLLDLMEQGHLTLDGVEEFVLDEADRMLDMGFMPDIRRILGQLPAQRHTQFFSATLSPEIMRLAKSMIKDPVQITISPDQPIVDKINQKLMFVDRTEKDRLLVDLLTNHPEFEKVLVFARTRHGADKIEKKLSLADISARAIHSDKSQRVRTDTMTAFRKGRVRVLVATDIASRGIDVDGITHVINFNLPEEAESYIHRIGRTARAGAAGAAISFVSAEERNLLRAIERMIRKAIDIDKQHAFHSERAEKAAGKAQGTAAPPKPAWGNKKRTPPERNRGDNDRRNRRPPGSSKGRNQTDYHQSARPDLRGSKDRDQTDHRQNARDTLPPPPWEESESRRPDKRLAQTEKPAKGSGPRWFDKPFQKRAKRHGDVGTPKADSRRDQQEKSGEKPGREFKGGRTHGKKSP